MEVDVLNEKLLEDIALLFPFLSPGEICIYNVQPQSRLGLLAPSALEVLAGGERKKVVFVGIGSACLRAINCVEIVKRKLSLERIAVHQRTKISFSKRDDVPEKELDPSFFLWSKQKSKAKSKIHTTNGSDVESVYILISLDPLKENDNTGISGGHLDVGSRKSQADFKRLAEAPANPWKRAKH